MAGEGQAGPFELIEKIGEGGMGEVWKARDTRLGRTVAIKLLPEAKQAESTRRQRLLREAQSVSALNHPNIITIFEVGSSGERDYIAMELVEGRSLAEIIQGKGLPVGQAIKLAIQAASAVAAAHAAGIIHRDLKPGNLMVRPDGLVKVLDFGLAKQAGTPGVEEATRTQALTEEGSIVGTAAYMSPEQAQGKTLDPRSDIFSFGAVLYEMLTGQRAFQGDSRASTLAAVLKDEPAAASSIVRGIPQELQRIVSRCVKKDPEKRFQTMADVRVALEEVLEETSSGRSRPAPVLRSHRTAIAAAVIAAISAGLGTWWVLQDRTPAARLRGTLTRLTPGDGYLYTEPAIDKDGRFVVYLSNRSGSRNLWLQHTGGGQAIQITRSTYNVAQQAISPDGSKVYYQEDLPTGPVIRRVSVLGGEPETLAQGFFPLLSPDGGYFSFATWDGVRAHVFVQSIGGGSPRELTNFRGRPPNDVCFSWVTPALLVCNMLADDDSKAVAVDTVLLPVDGSPPRKHNAREWFQKSGFETSRREKGATVQNRTAVFSMRRNSSSPFNLWEMSLDPKTLNIVGEARQLTFGSTNESYPVASDTGVIAYSNQEVIQDFFFLPLEAATGKILGAPRRLTRDTRQKFLWHYAAAGKLLLFALTGTGNTVIPTILDTTTARQTPLTETRLLTTPFIWYSPTRNEFITGITDSSGYSPQRFRLSNGFVQSSEKLCSDCGEDWTVVGDGRYMLNVPPSNPRSIRLFDLETMQSRVWASHPSQSFKYLQTIGSQWVCVGISQGKTPKTILIPWKPEAAPAESEWRPEPTDEQLKAGPAQSMRFARPDYYFLAKRASGDQMMHFHLDPATLRLSAVKPVEGWDKLTTKPTSEYPWDIGADGIVFQLNEERGDIWLLKPEK